MPSTYSPNLRLELIASGEQGNTWGNTTNNNLGSLVESAITGATVLTSLPATLTALNGSSDQARAMYLLASSSIVLTADSYIQAPASPKMYIVSNQTVGGFNVTIKASGTTGVVVPNGATKVVYYSATVGDFVEAVNSADKFYLTGAITGNTQATTKLYVDTADLALLPRDGSRNMTGALTLSNSTLSVGDAATTATPKGYVDGFNVLVNGTAGNTSAASGLVKTGSLNLGTLSLTLAPATSTNLGGVKPNSTFSLGVDGTLSLPATGVTANSYTNANITVDSYGRITAASNGSGGSSGITTINGTSPIQASTVGGTTTLSMIANAYYPYTGNPSGFLTSASLSGYATTSYVNSTVGNYLPLSGGSLTGNTNTSAFGYPQSLTTGLYNYSGTYYPSVGSNSGSSSYINLGFFQASTVSNRLVMYFGTVNGSAFFQADINALGTKNFRIDHPTLPNKKLYHVAVEAPRADLIYRGEVQLVGGTATVDIDTASRMTDGTFAALTQNVEIVSLYNKDGFTRVKGSAVVGNTFTITAEDPACTDTITWVVMAERNDVGMHSNPICDENGRVIPEQDDTDTL